MKKPFPKMILRILLVCVLLLGFLYMDDDIGTSAANLESDIRNLQKIPEDWIVEGDVSDTMAAYISYPQDRSDHTFSVYVNRPGLSFGYFFRGGNGDGTENVIDLFLSVRCVNSLSFFYALFPSFRAFSPCFRLNSAIFYFKSFFINRFFVQPRFGDNSCDGVF